MTYFVAFGGTRGPIGDPIGQFLFALTGAGQIVVLATSEASKKGVSGSFIAVSASNQLYGLQRKQQQSRPPGLRLGRTPPDPPLPQRDSAVYVMPTQAVINFGKFLLNGLGFCVCTIVSNVGAGVALIVSAYSSDKPDQGRIEAVQSEDKLVEGKKDI
jgi:hypothetical protein